MNEQEANAAFLAALRQSRERTELASAIYAALKTRGELHAHRRLTYRCSRKRCSLLDIVETPEGLLIGFPRYKTSPDVTRVTSSDSGRQNNTEDGYRRWKEHAAFAENVSNPPLACDHMHNVPLTDQSIDDDLAARHTEVRVRRDGTRFAVE